VLVSEIEARARRAGLLGEGQRITAAKLFKRAKAILGIQSIRQGFGPLGTWAWTLPLSDIVGAPEGAGHLTPDPDATVTAIQPAVDATHADMPPEFRDVVGVPRSWVGGVARLDRKVHRDVALHRWHQFVDDCHRFIGSDVGWAQRAADLGWDEVALFGCSPINPLGYLGSAGGHVVPGIDFTNDPLLQGRLFSYIDTQLRRVGPNFAELPINRPLDPVHNNQRDVREFSCPQPFRRDSRGRRPPRENALGSRRRDGWENMRPAPC